MNRTATSCLLAAALIAVPTAAHADTPPDAEYVVQYTGDADVAQEAADLADDGIEVTETFDAAQAVVVTMTDDEAAELDTRADVIVEEDVVIEGFTWNLDLVSQRGSSAGFYDPAYTASGVDMYVIDSGIYSGHRELAGRVQRGYSAIDDGHWTNDCQGHGTHVAGTIGGKTYGVARGVNLIPVRVLGCDAKGTLSGIVGALNWVAEDHKGGPAVANLSLGTSASEILDTAVNALIDDGVSVVVSAGNSSTDACMASPARTPRALTVAASDRSNRHAPFSNSGSCVDLYAPGVDVPSASHTVAAASVGMSGTSASAPHVAGAAALILAENPSYTPDQVSAAIVGNATDRAISGAPRGTTTKLLFVPSHRVKSSLNPTGTIDRVSMNGTEVTISGWARDPGSTGSITAHVYVDGKAVRAVRADSPRGDLERTAPGVAGPNHGYSSTFPVSGGRHTVCVYGINTGAGSNARLACKDVVASNTRPIGSFDSLSVPARGVVAVKGWALDPDTTSSIGVHAYVDGKFKAAFTAATHRPDVGRVYGKGDAHGFNMQIAVGSGRHTVCLYAIDSSGGSNPRFACRDVIS